MVLQSNSSDVTPPLIALINTVDVMYSFKEIYKSLESYSQFTEQTLDYLDKMGLTADKINSLNTGYKKLDSAIISKDQYQARVTNMLEDLANSGGDIETTIHMQFDDILNGLDEKK